MKRLILFAVVLLCCVGQGQAALLFEDDFDSGPSPLWGNEFGSWGASGGVYDASFPYPLTYSSLPFDLTDFSIQVDINDIGDGGIWLRSQDRYNGILLVTGGNGFFFGDTNPRSGRELYWHIISNNVTSPILNRAENVFDPGVSDSTIRVDVVGNTYKAYVDDVLITTFVDSTYTHGQVALYDSSVQTFDNVRLEANVIPEPSTLIIWSLLATLGITFSWHRRRKAV